MAEPGNCLNNMPHTLEKTLDKAKNAAHALALSPLTQRNRFLRLVSASLRKNQNSVLRANQQDVTTLGENHPLADRLLLDARLMRVMARDVEVIAAQPDPLGVIL